MLKSILDIKINISLLLLIINGFLLILFKICILNVIKNVDDSLLFFINTHIFYTKRYEGLLDSESEENIDEDSDEDSDGIYENKINEMIKFNCNTNKTINKYKHNSIKYKFPLKNKYYIINSFLFNVTGNNYKIVDKYRFTKKLIILYYLEKTFNTKSIKSLMPEYNYIYIFYKTDIVNNNEYKIAIIDLNNNYEILSKKYILFNNIDL
jgi:mRNA-degrading endonuclease HigB of HigAB toxin-antitoxin module